MTAPPRIAVVGTGPVGRAIALGYAACGGTVAAVVSRDRERARRLAERTGAQVGSDDAAAALGADVVIVAVTDRALRDVARSLARGGAPSAAAVLHTSGALAGDELAACGRPVGSLHPLQSFPAAASDGELAARLAGAHWFHEGAAGDVAAVVVHVLGGTIHRLAPGTKALYHAGAAVLSNHTVALADAALELFALAGIPRDEALGPLAALLAGTCANVASLGVPGALTGPIARGDSATVARHLAALAASAPHLVASYVALAERTLDVARRKGGLDETAAAEIARLVAAAR